MNGNFEILPTDNELVKKVVFNKHNFQMYVYYVGDIPSEIPDDMVFAFGFIDEPRPSGGQGIYVVFALPDHDKLAPDKRFRHVIVINAMHHYITKEWNKFWFDEVTYSKGYMNKVYDEKVSREHQDYLKRSANEIELKFAEWQNKHLFN